MLLPGDSISSIELEVDTIIWPLWDPVMVAEEAVFLIRKYFKEVRRLVTGPYKQKTLNQKIYKGVNKEV